MELAVTYTPRHTPEYYLGRLCTKGHDAGGGRSRRYRANTKCVACRKLVDAKRTQALTRGRRLAKDLAREPHLTRWAERAKMTP